MVKPSIRRPPTWRAKALLLTTGAGITLLGLILLLAWHLRCTGIIQVIPNSPPIRYNTALAFSLSGFTCLALATNQPRIAQGLSLLVALIGGLTLAQYAFHLDLGIDQWLMQDYLTNSPYSERTGSHSVPTEAIQLFFIKVDRLFPGRPSPNTAFSFVLVGIAMLCLSWAQSLSWAQTQRHIRVQQLTAAIAGVIGISIIVLLGYLTELGTAYGWRYLIGVSILTAVGLLWLNSSLLIVALHSGSSGASLGKSLVLFPRWFALSAGFGISTASLFLWQALVSWQQNLINQLSEFAAEVNAILNPVASIVLLEGILLALLVTLVMHFTLLTLQQRDKLEQLNQDLAKSNSLLTATLTAKTDSILVLDAEIAKRKQVEAALQEEAQRLAAVLTMQQNIAANRLQLDEIMRFIVHQAQQLTNASGAVIELIEVDELVYRAVSGAAIGHLGLRLNAATSFSGHCLNTGKLLYCQDTECDPRVDRVACRTIGVRSMIVVPLLHQQERIGVLKVFSIAPSAFANRDIQTLQLTAGFLSAEISMALEFESKQAALAALQESEERYRSVVTALSEGIVLQDAHGVICASNASAERILGLSLEQMMGRTSIDPCWQSLHEDGSLFLDQDHPAMVTLRTGEPCYGVVMGICKSDGNLTWISINSYPLMRLGEVLPYAVVASFTDITERKHAETLLQQSERRYRGIVEDQTELIARYLPDGTLTFVNKAYCRYFGVANAAIVGQPYEPLIFEDDRQQVAEQINSICLENPVVIIENRVKVNGEVRWTQWIKRGLFDPQGRLLELQTVGRDITERKQLEQALFHEKELAQVTLQSIGDAVITTDAVGNIEYFNPVAEALTGWKQAEVWGLPLKTVFNIVNETTRQTVENPIEQALAHNRIVGLANHTVLIARNGHEIAIEDSAAPIHDRTGEIIGAVMVFHDVTQTRALSQQLIWQASHDALTGLVNRREFEQQLEQALSTAKTYSQEHALFYLDLDRFKIVNDTCGHAAGDDLLRQVTELLQAQIRKTDILARLGGDEFGVLLHQCPPAQALRVANALRECLEGFRFMHQGQAFAIGVSIGLVGVTAESESLTNLLSAADAACYTAKNRGRNRVHVFQPDDEELLQQRGEMQWVTRLTQALEADRFCLYCQPIAAITDTGLQIDHYEVLLRLRDEQDNLIAPMAFIPAAERYNLMHRIDRWVIRTLFSQWSSMTNQDSKAYAINLSGASINDEEFVAFLYEQFAIHQISPQLICFEITETAAIANLVKANQLMRELQRLGCRFALDDFGSGMSSFGYLKHLSVNYLKIDGGFIKNIAADPVDAAMVEAITRIGHVMGIKTIAEFVENDAILERIKAIGVDYAQGYGIAAPCPYHH